jgi:glycerol-3-phosphate dehydrogenase (NAD+)
MSVSAAGAALDDATYQDPKQAPQNICVLGGGNFGTAMAFLAGGKGHAVRWYCRDANQAKTIAATRRNPRYLSDIELPDGLCVTSDVAEALRGADLIFSALPAQATPRFIQTHRDAIPPKAIFCCTSKGLYLEDGCFLSEAMLKAFERPQTLAFLSGPSFARQICERHPTALVCASAKLADAVRVQFALSSSRFRVYASQDTVGVELGGALKNPLAIGAGMIEGAGFGINTLAAFVTRATRELTVLCVAMGGRPETISGLAGVGDLMLTAFGDLSRNRNCGLRLAKGESLDSILKSCTVEGVPTASVAKAFATKCNLDLPLFTAVAMIIDGHLKVEDALDHLMSRPLGTEVPLL